MQPILGSMDGEVTGKLGRVAQEEAIYVENVNVAPMSRYETGETIALILRFNDGSDIGVALSTVEVRLLVDRLSEILASPDTASANLKLVHSPTGLQ